MASNDRIRSLGGSAVLAALVVGLFGLVGAVNGATQHNWQAAGVCLIASAVAFVGIAHVIFRE